MNDARAVLLARREVILLRIADQRRILAQNLRPLQRPVLCINLAASTWRLFSRHPGLAGGAALAVAAGPWRRPAKLLRRGWVAWQIVQGLRRAWRVYSVSSKQQGSATASGS